MPPMDAPAPPDDFYTSLPMFRDFTEVMDPSLFTPLPGDWVVGVADVVQSTKAIAENRYKAVNMAGAAVIVAVTNAMAGRDFPFVFGGDGASFAVPADAGALARQALAETATWVKEDLDLTLRIGMVPVADIRAQGLDVRVARYAPSENISIAMFSGGGMAWADSAMKHGEIAVPPAPPGAHPDLSGLSCRYEEIPASRGLVLSLVVAPGAGARPRRSAPRSSRSPASSRKRPMRRGRCRASGCASPGRRRAPISRRAPRAAPASWSARARSRCWRGRCLYFLVMRFSITVGSFIPAKYTRELIDNSDFRKFDDSLRMVLDCTPALADEIERHSTECAAQGRRALRHAPPAGGDDDVLHAVADQLQPRAFHRRRDGRLCDGGERDEGERGLIPRRRTAARIVRNHQFQRIIA